MIGKWSGWKPFPDPTKGGFIVAPVGPGCYELRLKSGQLVLYGKGGWLAFRMTSLHPGGAGSRRDFKKRAFVGKYLAQMSTG
jgi:hypothetical protein